RVRGLAVDPDGSRIFVASEMSNDVYAILIGNPTCGNGRHDDGEVCDFGSDPCCCDVNCMPQSCAAKTLDGSPCDDGSFCDGQDFVVGGVCTASGIDPCASGAVCANVCDESGDSCFAKSGVQCPDDGDPCTRDVCDGAGQCIHPPSEAGATCQP